MVTAQSLLEYSKQIKVLFYYSMVLLYIFCLAQYKTWCTEFYYNIFLLGGIPWTLQIRSLNLTLRVSL